MAYAVDAAELGTWDLNPVTWKFAGNERLKDWFGLSASDDIPLSHALDVIAEKDRSKVSAAITEALNPASGGIYQAEYTVVHPVTKKGRVVRARGRAYFDEKGNATRFNGILMDITAEVASRGQLQKLLKLVENSVDLMSILEMDGTNSYINAAGREILGIDADEDVSKIPISDFHTEDQIAFVESEILPNVMSKGKWAGQFAIRHRRTGEIIPLYNNCHRIDDIETGETIGVGAVMRDMRADLDARNRLEQKVKERTAALQAANEELENKNTELASFAYVSSHDLQEPLRKIRTFCERIRQKELDALSDTAKDFFTRIENAASRMQQLIEDLLNYSRVGWEVAKPEPTDLDALISEVLHELAEPVKQTDAEIICGRLGTVSVIPFQFRQLISNLLSNSLKFIRDGVRPCVVIKGEVDEANGMYHLSVTDNGIGFEEQYAEKIFELFQRLHGKHEFSGTGIGLAIVKKIVQNHGGMVKAAGRPGEGAVFEIMLPVQIQMEHGSGGKNG